MSKKGYFIGNCVGISIKIKDTRYEYPVFNKSIKYIDPSFDIEITDEKTKLALFKQRDLDGRGYYEVDDVIIEKAKELFKEDNLDFVEVDN